MMRGRAPYGATTPSPSSSPASTSSAFPFPSTPHLSHAPHYRPPTLDFSSMPEEGPGSGFEVDEHGAIIRRSPTKTGRGRPAGMVRAWSGSTGSVGGTTTGMGSMWFMGVRPGTSTASGSGLEVRRGSLIGLGLGPIGGDGAAYKLQNNKDNVREGYMKPRMANRTRRNRILLGTLFCLVIYLTLGRVHPWISTSQGSPDTSERVALRGQSRLKTRLNGGADAVSGASKGRVQDKHHGEHYAPRLALFDDHPNARSAGRYDYYTSEVEEERRRDVTRAQLPPYVAEHPTDADGLMRTNMSALHHPVYQLIHESRAAWDAKVAKQSTSLYQAVLEYRRRYKMEPPRGFDKWWAFVVENNVELPDEYDQIHRDLAPFRAYSPSSISKAIDRAVALPDTYSFRVKRGTVRLTSSKDLQASMDGARERMEGQLDMLRDVVRWIPDMTAVWGLHDTPQVIISHDHRRELQEFYDDGEYYDEDGNIELSIRGYQHACSTTSPMRRPLPAAHGQEHSFIASHLPAMDLCSHPGDLGLHGLVAGRNPHMTSLIPLFSLSKTALHADIVGVPDEKWTADTGAVGVERSVDAEGQVVTVIDLDKSAGVVPTYIPWKWKTEDKVVWRGTNTGSEYKKDGEPWWNSHRIRLVRMANSDNGEHEVLPLPREMQAGQTMKEGLKVKKNEELRSDKGGMDIRFAGSVLQCDEEDGTCDEIREEFDFANYMPSEAALKYRYVIDVDGNAWSARFQRLMLSGSLVFKSTITPEWWTDRIQPWVHYAPIKVSYSDLDDVLGFFRDPAADALAEQIANEGREWVLSHWRRVDMVAYTFRLYLEWARVSSKRRSKMDFVFHESMEVFRE